MLTWQKPTTVIAMKWNTKKKWNEKRKKIKGKEKKGKLRKYHFVRISPTCGQNAYQVMYGETLEFQHKQRKDKVRDRKIVFFSGTFFSLKTLPLLPLLMVTLEI